MSHALRSSTTSTLQFTLIGTLFDTVEIQCSIANAQELSSGYTAAPVDVDFQTGNTNPRSIVDSADKMGWDGLPKAQKLDLNVHCESNTNIPV